MKQGRYPEVIKTINKLDGQVYREFINPLINAWAYAGENRPDKALKELSAIEKNRVSVLSITSMPG